MTESEVYYVLHLHHGTSETNSNIITVSGFEYPKVKRNNHWLGNGIYFFREDREQALIWAKAKYKRDQSESEVHVLQTKFEINEENFLNLDTRGGMGILKCFMSEIEKKLKDTGSKITGDPAKLRNFIMDMLPKKYTVIQRTFDVPSLSFDKHPMFEATELHLHGTQICVRDKSVITGKVNVVMKGKMSRG